MAVFCVAGNGGEAVKTPGTGIAGLMAMVANGVTKQRNAAEREEDLSAGGGSVNQRNEPEMGVYQLTLRFRGCG